MAEIGTLRALAEKIANRPYVPTADVLLVSDTDSYYCRGRVADYEYRIHESVARCENGEAAAAIKGHDIWLPGPYLTKAWMQAILDCCGAHVYCEAGDPVIAGAGLVAINCPYGGERTLRLRNGKTVTLTLEGPATAALDDKTGERLL